MGTLFPCLGPLLFKKLTGVVLTYVHTVRRSQRCNKLLAKHHPEGGSRALLSTNAKIKHVVALSVEPFSKNL